MDGNISVRQECESDIQDVYKVNENAFQQKDEADLVNNLRQSPAFIPELSLVAVKNDTIVGYLLFTKITIGSEMTASTIVTTSHLGLAPLSVTSDCQVQGVGKMLIKEGFERAKTLGYTSVIVLGHEHYYSKFNFVPASHWNIASPFPLENTDVFKAIELVPGALEHVSGMVHYSKEFY
ncbi:N-acetyltransferase GCN5 [Absidia repens]|uniref:N-acetyltransferase GCN5 n=1 Tax=Absidia repens TaxID=90262 RepID=A0A1X2IKT3_9FUNG|nr:N-acetyltransferase GCN5 [Absidia repens]